MKVCRSEKIEANDLLNSGTNNLITWRNGKIILKGPQILQEKLIIIQFQGI